MNSVKREILPVGQGAFYLETLCIDNQTYKIIYDCGSATDLDTLKIQIQAKFNKGDNIHAVFISHLDDDHVNGLEFLLKYCNVKHLFFPLITDETKLLNEFLNLINLQSKFTYNFIKTEGGSVIRLNQDGLDQSVELHPISEESDSEELIGKTSKAIFGENRSGWIYLPHNFKNKGRLEQLKVQLKEKFKGSPNIIDKIFKGKDIDLENLKNLLGAKIEVLSIIKKAYQEISGSLNVNSMTLYSGRRYNHYFDCNCWTLHHYCNYCREFLKYSSRTYVLEQNGCLYTGDYEAGKYDKTTKSWKSYKQKWKSIEDVYSAYYGNIGLVQIPHHGSKDNYNESLRTKINSAVYFLSVGETNGYGHPHKEVIVDLLSRDRVLDIITENVHSTMTYYSYFL